MNTLKRYLISLLIFLALDALWLGVFAPDFYQSQVGFLLTDSPRWAAAGIFYLLFVLGLVIFVISPGCKSGQKRRSILMGAFFGLVTYATYDLTNLATLEGWTLGVTIVDMAWGTTLAALTTFFSLLLLRCQENHAEV